mmetsp:Transcript_58343/g.96665  ORF Transcript_58343/g.96665 Transcript_58343/m.96665 type:complete len:202 (+) Transcript_58343:1759-2364(+)
MGIQNGSAQNFGQLWGHRVRNLLVLLLHVTLEHKAVREALDSGLFPHGHHAGGEWHQRGMPVGLVVRVHGRVGLRVRQAAVAPTVAPLLHGQAPVGHQREAVAFEGPRLLQLRNGILLAALTGLLVGPHELRDLPDPPASHFCPGSVIKFHHHGRLEGGLEAAHFAPACFSLIRNEPTPHCISKTQCIINMVVHLVGTALS